MSTFSEVEKAVRGSRTTSLSVDDLSVFFSGPATPSTVLLLAAALEKKVIDPNVAVVQIIRSMVSSDYLVELALALRFGAMPNMYVKPTPLSPGLSVSLPGSSPSGKGTLPPQISLQPLQPISPEQPFRGISIEPEYSMHIIGYIYWILIGDTLSRGTAIPRVGLDVANEAVSLFLVKGANLTLPMYDNGGGREKKGDPISAASSFVGPSVQEWLRFNGYPILDLASGEIYTASPGSTLISRKSTVDPEVAILLDRRDLLSTSIDAKYIEVAVRSHSNSVLTDVNIPPRLDEVSESVRTGNHRYLFDSSVLVLSVEYLNAISFSIFVRDRGMTPSYILINSIIRLLVFYSLLESKYATTATVSSTETSRELAGRSALSPSQAQVTGGGVGSLGGGREGASRSVSTSGVVIDGSTVAKQALESMLLLSVDVGGPLDREQLNLISTSGDRSIYDNIIRAYSQPYWTKICSIYSPVSLSSSESLSSITGSAPVSSPFSISKEGISSIGASPSSPSPSTSSPITIVSAETSVRPAETPRELARGSALASSLSPSGARFPSPSITSPSSISLSPSSPRRTFSTSSSNTPIKIYPQTIVSLSPVISPYSEQLFRKESPPPPPRLRQIAFSVGLDPYESGSKLCNSLGKISTSDPSMLLEMNAKRQQLRMSSELGSLGTLVGGESTPTCRNQSVMMDSPLDYGDVGMSYYRDEAKSVWCFTSDRYQTLVDEGVNPYTLQPLPLSFISEVRGKLRSISNVEFYDKVPILGERTLVSAEKAPAEEAITPLGVVPVQSQPSVSEIVKVLTYIEEVSPGALSSSLSPTPIEGTEIPLSSSLPAETSVRSPTPVETDEILLPASIPTLSPLPVISSSPLPIGTDEILAPQTATPSYLFPTTISEERMIVPSISPFELQSYKGKYDRVTGLRSPTTGYDSKLQLRHSLSKSPTITPIKTLGKALEDMKIGDKINNDVGLGIVDSVAEAASLAGIPPGYYRSMSKAVMVNSLNNANLRYNYIDDLTRLHALITYSRMMRYLSQVDTRTVELALLSLLNSYNKGVE